MFCSSLFQTADTQPGVIRRCRVSPGEISRYADWSYSSLICSCLCHPEYFAFAQDDIYSHAKNAVLLNGVRKTPVLTTTRERKRARVRLGGQKSEFFGQ